jgi:hypothetical protein
MPARRVPRSVGPRTSRRASLKKLQASRTRTMGTPLERVSQGAYATVSKAPQRSPALVFL